MHVFDLIHDLQRLRAKSALVPLDDAEQARLDGLVRLLTGSLEDDEDEPTLVRLLRPLPCHLAVPGRGFVEAELRMISADGLTLKTDEPLLPNDMVIVHVDAFGARYTFPCRVYADSLVGLLVTFDGVPARERESAA